MTSFTAREVRAWALANGIDCPDRGPVQQRVIDAYLAAIYPDAVPADDTVSNERDEDDVEEPMFRVTCDIPGDPEAGREIANYLLEAVWAAFESGRRVERARLLAQLGADA